MSPRAQKVIVVACIALVVFAAFMPGAITRSIAVVLTPLGLAVSAVLITIVRRQAARSDAQPVALLSLVLLRAPPVVRLCS